MPTNDNWEAIHECDWCGHTQFVLIDNRPEKEFRILCARCGKEHLVIDSEPD